MKNKYPITVISAGLGDTHLPTNFTDKLDSFEVICAGKLHLKNLQLRSLLQNQENLVIDANIANLMSKLKERQNTGKKILVLAAGDPLFFGFAASLLQYFEKDELNIYAGISSMQIAAASLRLPWANLRCVSLHGISSLASSSQGKNNYNELGQALISKEALCILLDKKNNLPQITKFMDERGCRNYCFELFANLNSNYTVSSEQNLHYSLSFAEALNFRQPLENALELVILIPQSNAQKAYLGLEDTAIRHEANLITKKYQRAQIISALALQPTDILLDIGAGSAALSLEASSLLTHGTVYAIEKRKARVQQILENRKKFQAANLEVIENNALDALADLPLADKIFIGGGLGKDQSTAELLLSSCWNKLKKGGKLVISCVLLSSLEQSRHTLKLKLKADPEIFSCQLNLAENLAQDLHFKAQNPIFIICAIKTN